VSQGLTLTTNEQAYLKRIRQVPYLMRFDLVPPVAPPPAPPAPVAPAIAASPAPLPAPPAVPPKPVVPLKAMTIHVHADGTVRFHGLNMGLAQLQSTLQKISQTRPLQPFIIAAKSDTAQDKIQAVQAALSAANFQQVTMHIEPAAPAAASPPAPPAQPADVAESASASDLLKPRLTAPTIGSAERLVPLEIDMHPGGKIVMDGQPVAGLDDLKSRLTNVAQEIPNQPVVIRKDRKVHATELKKVLAICHDLKLKATSMSATPSEPPPEPAPASAADNALPAPEPMMHPAMQLSTGDPAPTPAAKPTPGP
jgi:biopolymer transport protein ExbD